MIIKTANKISFLSEADDGETYGITITGKDLSVEMKSAAIDVVKNNKKIYELNHAATSIFKDKIIVSIEGDFINENTGETYTGSERLEIQ